MTASAEVVSAQEAQMGFAMSGQVETAAVELGDAVQEGDTLAFLKATARKSFLV